MSTYFENGNCTRHFVIRKRALARPAAKIVPLIKFSLMKIAKIGSIKPKPVPTNISENINNFIVLFI